MKVNVQIKPRTGSVFAMGEYSDEGLLVLKGGRIRLTFAEHIKGGKTAKQYRENPEYVDKNGNIIKDCLFSSPSTAAQFVLGSSTNGYDAWKVESKKSLGDYLKENNLR